MTGGENLPLTPSSRRLTRSRFPPSLHLVYRRYFPPERRYRTETLSAGDTFEDETSKPNFQTRPPHRQHGAPAPLRIVPALGPPRTGPGSRRLDAVSGTQRVRRLHLPGICRFVSVPRKMSAGRLPFLPAIPLPSFPGRAFSSPASGTRVSPRRPWIEKQEKSGGPGTSPEPGRASSTGTTPPPLPAP